MRKASRDEDKGPRSGLVTLVPKLPPKLTIEDVDRLVLAGMDVERRAVARRSDRLHSRKCAIRFLALDKKGDVAAEWATDPLALPGANCDSRGGSGCHVPPSSILPLGHRPSIYGAWPGYNQWKSACG